MNTAEDELQAVAGMDFTVAGLGEATLASPLGHRLFVSAAERVSYFTSVSRLELCQRQGRPLPSFEAAGPRERLFHDPAWTRAAIVTCGGLCPGLNDVIKALVNTLYFGYGVKRIFGIQYGYRGLNPDHGLEPVALDPDAVDLIHEKGGSILGSSRGQEDVEQMVRTLDRYNLNLLFCVGGDGTLRGAHAIALKAQEKNLPLSVIGVPKTIDNDLCYMDRTFGFETAVSAAVPVISSAHDEAKGAYNGVGLVRFMGRDSGFIAASAALANSVVNFCLIPEVPFELEGPRGLLPALERRLEAKHHVVIVVAEGAGQHFFTGKPETRDASGNLLHHDIGVFLRERIHAHLQAKGIEHSMKYFDPSYQIRSVPARGTDPILCLHLAENAVHAAMAGRTDMVVGHWHGSFTHVPLAMATHQRRRIDPQGQLWQSVLAVTLQERYWPV